MTDITKYAHILQALGEGKTVQINSAGRGWIDADPFDILSMIAELHRDPPSEFRIAPSTVTLTYDIPKPMMERPQIGNKYWMIDLEGVARYGEWEDNGEDQRRFKNGIYATEADAQAAADAHKAAMAALGVK